MRRDEPAPESTGDGHGTWRDEQDDARKPTTRPTAWPDGGRLAVAEQRIDPDHPERIHRHQDRRQAARHGLLRPDDGAIPKADKEHAAHGERGPLRPFRESFAADAKECEEQTARYGPADSGHEQRRDGLESDANREIRRAPDQAEDDPGHVGPALRQQPSGMRQTETSSRHGKMNYGKKIIRQRESPTSEPPPGQPRSKAPIVAAGLILIALAVGVFTYLSDSASSRPIKADRSSVKVPDRPIPANLKPHLQENLPPLNFPGYPTTRRRRSSRRRTSSPAEHPEVLSYVPCFCGCEHMGHRGNEDCFVKARDVNGDVIQWEDHGMECAVCLDVATRSLQMYTSGASVSDIRAAIEKEFTPLSTNHTPTASIH